MGVLRLLLQVPGSRSLKDRRRAVLSLVERIASRHHASAAEVGYLENPGMAAVAAVVVANDPRVVRSRLDAIRGEAERSAHAVLVDSTTWVEKKGDHE